MEYEDDGRFQDEQNAHTNEDQINDQQNTEQ
jgi:hypothetical protein